jgi:transposase
VIHFEDETTLRWFPPLRGMWAPRGEQAEVPITGQNAKRVLFGAINFRTGHRVVLRRSQSRQADFQEFLRHLRRRYGGRPLYLLLDKAPCHDTQGSRGLAARLGIELVWLPKQCSELNAMDHLWKPVKGRISANWQWSTVDEHADHAERWVLGLSDREALRKAGILSEDFWLRHL